MFFTLKSPTKFILFVLLFLLGLAQNVYAIDAHEPARDPIDLIDLNVIHDDAPVVESTSSKQNYDLTLSLRNGTQYALVGAPYSDENRISFESMSEKDQQRFLERRALYLKKVTSLLHYTKLIYGSGSIAFNKIKIVASPLIALLKFSMGTAYSKAKGLLFFAKEFLASSALAKSTPALSIKKRALAFAKKLIFHSNTKLKVFNDWLLKKVYSDLPPEQIPGFTHATSPPADIHPADGVALPLQELAATSVTADEGASEVVQAAGGNTPANAALLTRIRERSAAIVLKLLQRLDRLLWEQSNFVVSQNEVVIVASLNLTGLSGFGSQVRGGLPHGLGLKLGLNWESHALVFEIFHETEALSYALTPSSAYGLTPKIGLAFLTQNLNNEMGSRSGYYMYPVSIGASPGYTAALRNTVTFGFTTNLLTAPFSMLGDFFWYNTHAAQRPLVRLTFSPKSFGFLRVKFLSFKAPPQTPGNREVDKLALPVKLIVESLDAAEKTTDRISPPTTCLNILKRAD